MPTVEVSGRPMPRGSMRAFVNPHSGRPVITDMRRRHLRRWMKQISDEARAGGAKMMHGPIAMDIDFRMPRPLRGVSRNVVHHPKRPDLDKLLRAVLDALTGVFYADDSQVAILGARKIYSDTPGITILVSAIKDTPDEAQTISFA